jgi:hypothetical protein
MMLWTVTEDYFATGEGRTVCVMFCYAENEAEAKAEFIKQFGAYFGGACVAEEGVKNEYAKILFSDAAIDNLKALEREAGSLLLFGQFHFNLRRRAKSSRDNRSTPPTI